VDRPTSFPDENAAEQYLRLTSPGYTDAAYANRLRWLFGRDERGLVWRSDANALRQVFAAAEGRPAWADLATLRCPLLVVRGTRSIYLSAATARRMVATVPGARLVELDAGHNVQLDRPAELAEAIVALAGALPV
jgi:pimeloyl-ACP methyl ester carboxylesterase